MRPHLTGWPQHKSELVMIRIAQTEIDIGVQTALKKGHWILVARIIRLRQHLQQIREALIYQAVKNFAFVLEIQIDVAWRLLMTLANALRQLVYYTGL